MPWSRDSRPQYDCNMFFKSNRHDIHEYHYVDGMCLCTYLPHKKCLSIDKPTMPLVWQWYDASWLYRWNRKHLCFTGTSISVILSFVMVIGLYVSFHVVGSIASVFAHGAREAFPKRLSVRLFLVGHQVMLSWLGSRSPCHGHRWRWACLETTDPIKELSICRLIIEQQLKIVSTAQLYVLRIALTDPARII